MILVKEISSEEHLKYIELQPSVSFLQTPAWGKTKAGWIAKSIGWYEGDQLIGSGLVLLRKVPKVKKYLAYLPEGPDFDWTSNQVSDALTSLVNYLKPIGVFHMADDKGPDEKVICVPVSDPIWNKLNDLSDVNPHLIKEIEHFFQVYKDLEHKKVDVEGWGDVNEAKEILRKCTNRFNELENKPEGLFSIK